MVNESPSHRWENRFVDAIEASQPREHGGASWGTDSGSRQQFSRPGITAGLCMTGSVRGRRKARIRAVIVTIMKPGCDAGMTR